MLSLACDWEIIDRKPRIKLRKEVERTAVFDAGMEERFLKVARQPLRDVFLISHDSGLRPEEVIRMRWENVLWKKNLIYVPNGKTEQAKRYVPLSQRVHDLLLERKARGVAERKANEKSEWVFPSKAKKESHISYFPIAKQLRRRGRTRTFRKVSCCTRRGIRSRPTCSIAPATSCWWENCSAIEASRQHNATCIRR